MSRLEEEKELRAYLWRYNVGPKPGLDFGLLDRMIRRLTRAAREDGRRSERKQARKANP